MWRRRGSVSPFVIREITFREQKLNWLFAKYKRLENNPLYGTVKQDTVLSMTALTCIAMSISSDPITKLIQGYIIIVTKTGLGKKGK